MTLVKMPLADGQVELLTDSYNTCIEKIDFNKIHKVMAALNWTWRNNPLPPTIDEMKGLCDSLFSEALHTLKTRRAKEGTAYCASGGFKVELDANNMEASVSFIVENWKAS